MSNEDVGEVKEDSWMELKIAAEYFVVVNYFGSCSSFFLQIIDENDKWEEMMEMVVKMMKTLKPLENLQVGQFCLEMHEKELYRAKIIRASENSTAILCVDNGRINYYHNMEVEAYEMPSKVRNFMPFQAVNCRLAGVSAPSDCNWTNFIYQKVVARICQPKIRVIKKLKQNPDMIPWGLEKVNCYDVELFDGGSKDSQTVADILVKYQLADYIT